MLKKSVEVDMQTPEPRVQPDDDPCEDCSRHLAGECPHDYERGACLEEQELAAADHYYDMTT